MNCSILKKKSSHEPVYRAPIFFESRLFRKSLNLLSVPTCKSYLVKCTKHPDTTWIYMPSLVAYIPHFFLFVVLSFAVVHLSILTIQRRLALSLHKDDTLYKEIYHFFRFSKTVVLHEQTQRTVMPQYLFRINQLPFFNIWTFYVSAVRSWMVTTDMNDTLDEQKRYMKTDENH